MPRERPGLSTDAAVKWEPFLDDGGNLYFYNHVTGESVWELPPDDGEEQEHTLEQSSSGGSKLHDSVVNLGGDGRVTDEAKEYSQYSVTVGAVETVVKLVDAVDGSDGDASPVKAAKSKEKKKNTFMSPAAEARRRRNDAKVQKRKQRLHDMSAEKYMKLVLHPVSPSSGARDTDKMAEGDARLRCTGSLFTAQDSEQWQRELKAESARERRAGRKQRQQHKLRVRSLKQQRIMLLQLRTELTKHLLGEIQCSPELLKRKILLLSSQTPGSIMSTSRLEPEIVEKLAAAERQAQDERLRAIQAVFELLDSANCGKVRLVSVITGIFAHEAQVQQYCAVVAGLGELLSSPRLQQLVISFAASRQHDCDVSALEFREFICIIEEAWDYYTRVKTAVHDAENEIDAAIEAATLRPGTGVMRARMGFVSKKKAEHELTQLRATTELLRSLSSDTSEEMLWLQGDSSIQPKEEWEKDHHHRFIRAAHDGSSYCCLCRRRQWELARNETDEREQRHRDEWPMLLELRLKQAEARMAGGTASVGEKTEAPDAAGSASSSPTNDDHDDAAGEHDFISYKLMTLTDDNEIAVLEVIHTLLVVIESMTSEHDGEQAKKRGVHHRVHRRRKRKAPKNSSLNQADPATGLSPMQIMENAIQAEELARRALFEEERAMRIELERYKRRLERPLLRFQETASDNYVRILERCVNLPPLLSNLRFERSLTLSSYQKMTLLMVDSASPTASTPDDARLILYTLPHRSESEANYSFAQMKVLQQHLRSPFVVRVRLVDTRSFQSFADSGMLVESWPMQFVATEFFARGSWLDFYRRWIHNRPHGDTNAYAQVEQHVLAVFRDVATGVSAMHSLGVLHLNIKADNIYVCSDAADVDARSVPVKTVRVKIGGLLAWKAGYGSAELAQGDILECMHFNYAPPEALDRRPITPKADVWMLGCAIYDALLTWQHVQLAATTSSRSTTHSPIVFSSRSVQDLVLMLPLVTSEAVRSLLRMLLQPEPKLRPDMSQVAEYISFAGVNQPTGR